jgi:hypothetical protein
LTVPKLSNRLTTTEKDLMKVLDLFIDYDKVSPNKNQIQITSVSAVESIPQLIEAAESANRINITSTSRRKNIITKPNRDYLLDYVIYFQNQTDIVYLTKTQIIWEADIFNKFYYDFSELRYDGCKPTPEEIQRLNDFVNKHNIDPNYLLSTMDGLNEIVYTEFSGDNISSWTSKKDDKRNIDVDKVLYQHGEEVDDVNNNYYEKNYMRHYENYPKWQAKLANQKYVKENGKASEEHSWFYYTYKFTKNDIFYPRITDDDLIHNQKELNNKIIEKLEAKVKQSNSAYHTKNKNDFDYIINNILL